MSTDDLNKAAIGALNQGELTKLLEGISNLDKTSSPLTALLRAAFEAGAALKHAEIQNKSAPPQALDFLQFMAAGPAAPEGFRTLREQLGISQTDIAKFCGITSNSSVSNWENGVEPVPPKALQALMVLAAKKLHKPNPEDIIFGAAMRALRKKLGMSQPDFAAALSVSKSTIEKWEREPNTRLTDAMVHRIRPQLDGLNARAVGA